MYDCLVGRGLYVNRDVTHNVSFYPSDYIETHFNTINIHRVPPIKNDFPPLYKASITMSVTASEITDISTVCSTEWRCEQQIKHLRSALEAFYNRNHPSTVVSPHNVSVMRECHAVIMARWTSYMTRRLRSSSASTRCIVYISLCLLKLSCRLLHCLAQFQVIASDGAHDSDCIYMMTL